MSTPPDKDLTRKERREQARTERKAVEEAHAAADARRRRLTIVGSIVAVVAIAAIAIVLLTNKSESHQPTNAKETSKVQNEVNETLKGTVQNGAVLGDPKAPVTLQYFGDLECPVCRDFTLGALGPIIQKYVTAGQLKIEYRSLSTATGNAEASGAEPTGTFKNQQTAALAAGPQKLMWNYIETFYREQGEEASGYVTESFIEGIAKQIAGLDTAKWQSARGNPAFAKSIEEDAAVAASKGFSGTPSFLIGKTGGTLEKFEPGSLTEPAPFEQKIEQLLKA